MNFARGFCLFVATALLLIFVYPHWGFDAAVMAHYYDAGINGFPLRDNPILAGMLHDKLRIVLWIMPIATLVALVRSAKKNGWSLATRRWTWLFVAQIIAPLTVSLLKQHTTPICPWHMLEYGGKLAEPAFAFVARAQAGQCFPAGHPSMGWGALAFYYFWSSSHPQRARIALVAALLLGAVMAWVQIARGAHLPSHVLWSLWVDWLVIWLLYHFVWPKAKV